MTLPKELSKQSFQNGKIEIWKHMYCMQTKQGFTTFFVTSKNTLKVLTLLSPHD